MNKAVFLDRDGIINQDRSYVYKIEDFSFCEGIFDALRHFQTLGYKLIIVTNQSGIGRGYYTENDFEILSRWMCDRFLNEGICIDAVYHCPHSPDAGCLCRKPLTKLFDEAIKKFDIDATHSWMIGDKQSDIDAGHNARITQTIFINNSIYKQAKYSVQTILDTISIIKT